MLMCGCGLQEHKEKHSRFVSADLRAGQSAQWRQPADGPAVRRVADAAG